MSETKCASCGATTNNGLVLCELCQYAATKHFEVLPVYFRNLSRWRPGRAGSRPVPGSRVLYDGEVRSPDATGDRISDRLSEAKVALLGWADALADDRGFAFTRPLTLADAVIVGDLSLEQSESFADNPATAFTWLCAGLEHHLLSIGTLEWAGEMLRDLAHHEARLRSLIELVPGWYAGACQRKVSLDASCGSLLYVMPGLTWVTCSACGSTTAARDHLEVVLNEARDWTARPKHLAEAIVALVDSEQSVPRLHDRIRQWESRKLMTSLQRIERQHVYVLAEQQFVVRDVPTGPKRYRLGDVLDLLTNTPRASAVAKAV